MTDQNSVCCLYVRKVVKYHTGEFRFFCFFASFTARRNEAFYISAHTYCTQSADALCLTLWMQFLFCNSSGFVSWNVCGFISSLCSQLLDCLKIRSMLIVSLVLIECDTGNALLMVYVCVCVCERQTDKQNAFQPVPNTCASPHLLSDLTLVVQALPWH